MPLCQFVPKQHVAGDFAKSRQLRLEKLGRHPSGTVAEVMTVDPAMPIVLARDGRADCRRVGRLRRFSRLSCTCAAACRSGRRRCPTRRRAAAWLGRLFGLFAFQIIQRRVRACHDLAQTHTMAFAKIDNAVAETDDPLVRLNATIEVIAMKDAAKIDREHRAIQLDTLKKHLASGETALIEWTVDDVLQSEPLLVVKGSPAYPDLCQRLQRVQIQVLECAAERDAGN
ncbi:hypothetical protein I3J27_35255 [Bradyrhizobium xenonodulans]|uniref:Uncharacterized protein n=1 Tax=Bradyrhizobium xenonodulans TaxID=2736875 RepID=A0ABY7MMK2_9BRAD|nr:hypothetical protein [Bradyrhizobium xenonodulans]WBL78145.1 hypothetical protein I3J27_35255 [Bradyrhizobium xenonodulans]